MTKKWINKTWINKTLGFFTSKNGVISTFYNLVLNIIIFKVDVVVYYDTVSGVTINVLMSMLAVLLVLVVVPLQLVVLLSVALLLVVSHCQWSFC